MGLAQVLRRIMSLYQLQPMSDADQGQMWLMKALDLLPKPFFLVDYQQKRVSFSNAAARHILGLEYATKSVAEVYGKEISAFDVEGRLIPIERLPSTRVAQGEKIDGEELLLVTLTGQYNIKVYSGEIPQMHNRPAVGLIIFQDITTLKRTEQNLLRAQSDLNEAVENAMVGFWSLDVETQKTTISPQLEKQFGLLPGEYDGSLASITTKIHKDDIQRVEREIQQSIATKSPYKIEYRVVHNDGSIRWIEAKGGLAGDTTAQRQRFSGTTLDITERVNARMQIEASEKEFRLLADSMPQIVWSADSSGMLDYFNQVWFDYSGSNFEQNRGVGWAQFVHPEDIPLTQERWQKALVSCEPYENEFRLRHHSGEYRWHVARARPIFHDSTNKVVKKWYGTNTDIHEQKVLTEKLAEARVLAERASTTKSQFLANMSHEIRTPLGAIMGFSQLIKEQGGNDVKSEEFISVIERNSSQLLRIIDDILDLSKVEAGMMQIENIEFNLSETLSDFATQMKLKAEARGICFQMKTLTELPQMIVSDVTRLRQILMNVVGNAIKFTDQGHVELQISCRQQTLTFVVVDTGRGISQEQVKNLFQPFTQADASITRKYGGTGLGLTLTRSLAEAMGGTFQLKNSEPGVGSTFEIQLPFKNVLLRTQETKPAPKAIETGKALEGLKVLLVEDSLDNQALLSIYLERAGALLSIASDGREGIERATSQDFDVVLMDVQMPVMDGITAVKKLREDHYKKPIVALTAHAMKEERERCLASGFTEFLTKPIAREELIRLLTQFKNISLKH